MPRYFERITQPELREKIVEAIERIDDPERLDHDVDPVLGIPFDSYNIRGITAQVQKDLSKVQFDLENVDWTKDFRAPLAILEGFNTLGNGLTYFGVMAGGDWEEPLFFIIYWDGNTLRGYIPEKGNPWDKRRKVVFGNNEDDPDPEVIAEMSDMEEVKDDIRERIVERT